jgi:hypothetical protein
MGWIIRSLNSNKRARHFSLLHDVHTDSGAHPALYSMDSFPGVKRPGRQVYHSPPASTEVKDEWSCTSAVPVCLHGVDRYSFTFFLIFLSLSFLSPCMKTGPHTQDAYVVTIKDLGTGANSLCGCKIIYFPKT